MECWIATRTGLSRFLLVQGTRMDVKSLLCTLEPTLSWKLAAARLPKRVPAFLGHLAEDGSGNFAVYFAGDQRSLHDFRRQMDSHFRNLTPVPAMSKNLRGRRCFAACIDGVWERVRLLTDGVERKEVAVVLVDQGKKTVLSTDSLFMLPESLTAFDAAFALRCILPDDATLDLAGAPHLNQFYPNQSVCVTVISSLEPCTAILESDLAKISIEQLLTNSSFGYTEQATRLWMNLCGDKDPTQEGFNELNELSDDGDSDPVSLSQALLKTLPEQRCTSFLAATLRPGEEIKCLRMRLLEQEILLAHLQPWIELIYSREERRKQLQLPIPTGTSCVLYDETLQIWIRGTVQGTPFGDVFKFVPIDLNRDIIYLGHKFVDANPLFRLDSSIAVPPLSFVVRPAKSQTATKSRLHLLDKYFLVAGMQMRLHFEQALLETTIKLLHFGFLQEFTATVFVHGDFTLDAYLAMRQNVSMKQLPFAWVHTILRRWIGASSANATSTNLLMHGSLDGRFGSSLTRTRTSPVPRPQPIRKIVDPIELEFLYGDVPEDEEEFESWEAVGNHRYKTDPD